jgi:hypothetical protein
MFERAPVGELFDVGPLLLAYAISGVIETAAESLATPAVTVETALRSGRTLRDLAHDVRRDPEELRLALARGARSAEIDDRTAPELLAAAGNLLDLPLLVGPP